MREVAIIGIGQTAVDEHWDKSIREIAGEAVLAAMTDATRDRGKAYSSGICFQE